VHMKSILALQNNIFFLFSVQTACRDWWLEVPKLWHEHFLSGKQHLGAVSENTCARVCVWKYVCKSMCVRVSVREWTERNCSSPQVYAMECCNMMTLLVCVCVYIYIHMYIYMIIYIYICTNTYKLYVYEYSYIYIVITRRMCVCVRMCICVYMHAYIYCDYTSWVYIYIHTYMYKYTYIHLYIDMYV